MASLFQVFLFLMMLVHWLYLKVNSAEREHAPNDVVGKVTVQSLRVSSDDRRTTVREQTVKQCTELQSALDFFATRQLNGLSVNCTGLTIPSLPLVLRPMGCSPSSHHAGLSVPAHHAQLSMPTHRVCMSAPTHPCGLSVPTQWAYLPG